MVTRKPVPAAGNPALAPSQQSPPYPVTPISTHTPAPFRVQDASNQLTSPDVDAESEHAWNDEGPGRGGGNSSTNLPDSLRVGPHGQPPHTSQEALRPSTSTSSTKSTNPFLHRKQTQESLGEGEESSANAWSAASSIPPPPASAPPPPPNSKDNEVQIEQFANLSVSEPSSNPWQPALDQKPSSRETSIPPLRHHDSGNEAWSEAPPARQAPQAPQVPSVDTSQPVLVDLEEPESPAWDEDEPSPVVHEMPADNVAETHQITEDRHAWDEAAGQQPLQQNSDVTASMPDIEESVQQADGWNIIEHKSIQEAGEQESGVISGGEMLEPLQEAQAPALPPRRSQDIPPMQPPRPVVNTTTTTTSSVLSPGGERTRLQKKETYEIKRITWHDVTAAENPRVSPILVQNANGPCPLLALVNALTLSTPANVETALVETLRSREQVSLGLLLDAVFDELMSGRRGDAAHELPDVSDLYSFLITLHTGMNVNPRFFPLPVTRKPNDPRNSISHLHPSEREASHPGAFEETREMKLYSTFSIPLIHGWLPELDSPAFRSLKRSAVSYEDAQNLMFREEELEDKLHREGLSFEEQATLEDIATIKAFLATNATQLTPHGLDNITTSLSPGAVAILFRNDHFSTLYRHPETLQLLQLVTDMGYAGHDEVVWEALIDVNGENAEFFSGDFLLVGGAPTAPAGPTQKTTDGWTTVQGGYQNQHRHQPSTSPASHHETISETPQSPSHEQEDHDLALALQLQEEEEENQRAEVARRRRETELSQQYIEQQGSSQNQHHRGNNVSVTQRGGSTGARGRGGNALARLASEARPAIPPRRNNTGLRPVERPVDPEAGVDAPPPSYEQAAGQAAYTPPPDHPAHPSSSPVPSVGRRTSAYSANSAMHASPGVYQGPGNRRANTLISQIPNNVTGGRRNTQSGSNGDKDCAVM